MTTMTKPRKPSFRVFVVELDGDAWPRRHRDRPNVFVGITSGEPRQRFEQLMVSSSTRHQVVREHGVCLRTDLTKNYAPTTEMDARRQKRKLIKKLNNQAYTVNGDIRMWRVYVIELDDGVGPRVDDRFSWIYVGETARDPDDRFEQHKSGARNQRGPLFSKVVRDHGVDLRRDLYEHLPPLYTAASAKAAERKLAERLATLGYSVKGGH